MQWADRQSNQVRLGSAQVKLIDSRDIKFSAKEPAMEGNRHYVSRMLLNDSDVAFWMWDIHASGRSYWRVLD